MATPDTTALEAAKAALEGHRAAYERCPSPENRQKVADAEEAMNTWLDRWASASRASSPVAS